MFPFSKTSFLCVYTRRTECTCTHFHSLLYLAIFSAASPCYGAIVYFKLGDRVGVFFWLAYSYKMYNLYECRAAWCWERTQGPRPVKWWLTRCVQRYITFLQIYSKYIEHRCSSSLCTKTIRMLCKKKKCLRLCGASGNRCKGGG